MCWRWIIKRIQYVSHKAETELTSWIIILASFLYACLKTSINLIDKLCTQAYQTNAWSWKTRRPQLPRFELSTSQGNAACLKCGGKYHASIVGNLRLSNGAGILNMAVWRSSSALVSINEVNLHPAWLVLGWVTMSGFNSWCQHLSQYVTTSQPPRSAQPSIPPGSINEYQLRLGRQRQVWFIPLADVCGVCR